MSKGSDPGGTSAAANKHNGPSNGNREISSNASSTRQRSAGKERTRSSKGHAKGHNNAVHNSDTSVSDDVTDGHVRSTANGSRATRAEHEQVRSAAETHDRQRRREHAHRSKSRSREHSAHARENTAARIIENSVTAATQNGGHKSSSSAAAAHAQHDNSSSRGSSAQTTASRGSSASVADVSSRESSAQSLSERRRVTSARRDRAQHARSASETGECGVALARVRV